jgi:hydrogen peroxide-dependent heme synthase
MHSEQTNQAGELPVSVPAAPLTLEGSSVLHQMFRLRRATWRTALPDVRRQVLDEAVSILEEMEQPDERQSAFYSLLGHKGDLLLLHFRRDFQELNEAELRLAGLKLADYLEATASYLSVVELGLYESSVRLYKSLVERGVRPGSAGWEKEVEDALAQHRKAMAPRLCPSIPEKKYICFYPMDRKRAQSANWYRLPMEERRRLMREHGEIGRKYAQEVTQIISGSIGFDDWEWGVDLFSDDPLAFKKLIYEMRFDEASALYALFGPFYVGVRVQAQGLGALLDGRS